MTRTGGLRYVPKREGIVDCSGEGVEVLKVTSERRAENDVNSATSKFTALGITP